MTCVKRLAGAVALGLGTVLGGGRRDRHWSEAPVLEVVEEEQAASGDELDDPALVLVERRLRAAEVDLDELSGGPTGAPHGRTPEAARHREAEGRLAALLDARRAVRRGTDARLAVGVTVASWEAAMATASRQGPTWLTYRWAGAQELSALADELAALDRPDAHPPP